MQIHLQLMSKNRPKTTTTYDFFSWHCHGYFKRRNYLLVVTLDFFYHKISAAVIPSDMSCLLISADLSADMLANIHILISFHAYDRIYMHVIST